MNVCTLTAFQHELGLIKKADAATWTPPKIAPVAVAKKAWAAAPKHSPEVQKGLSNLFKNYGSKALSKFGSATTEALKRAVKSPEAAGALLGGSLSAVGSVRGEMKRRNNEDLHPDKEAVTDARRKRLGRMAVTTAAGAIGGGILGHAGKRGYHALKGEAQKAIGTVPQHVKDVSSHIAKDVVDTSTHLKNQVKDVGEVAKDVNQGAARRLFGKPSGGAPKQPIMDRIKGVFKKKAK